GSSLCESQHLAGLLQRESREEAELHDLGSGGFFLSQHFQRFIDQKQRVVVRVCGNLNLVQIEPFPTTTAFASCLGERAVNERAAHGCGRRGEKMSTISEVRIRFLTSQPKPGLMHPRG